MSDLGAIDENAVTLPVGRQRIRGTVLKPEVPVPGILFVHGWGGDQGEDLGQAEELARLGCLCFTFDLRGHAGSDAARDAVSRQDSLEDVLAAYDYLVSLPLIDASAIAVVGTSYGGYLSALLTAQRPVRWLALRVPALYPDTEWDTPKARLDKARVRAYRETRQDEHGDRALAACARFEGDVLIVESGDDQVIPHEAILSYQSSFRSAQSVSHRTIRGADHALRDPKLQGVYTRMLVGWIGDMVRASRVG